MEENEVTETQEDIQAAAKPASVKELQKRISARILEEWDATLAQHVLSNNKLGNVYTDFTEMTYFMTAFNESNPVTLSDAAGNDVLVPFTINDGLRFKEVVGALKEKVTAGVLQQFVEDQTKGTHLEAFAKDYEEQVNIIEGSIKQAQGTIKKAFKTWVELISAHYEANHNLIVEMSIIDNELRIMGLWTLGAHKGKEQEFYINPEYFADHINSKCKKMAKMSTEATDVVESLGSISNPQIHAEVALNIKSSIDQMPGTISATTDLVKMCKNYKLSAGAAKKQKKLVAEVDGDLETTVEEI